MNVGDYVIYTGNNLDIYNLFKDGKELSIAAEYFLIINNIYKINEIDTIHPSYTIDGIKGLEYCKLEGCDIAFPCELFIQIKEFIKNKYNLK